MLMCMLYLRVGLLALGPIQCLHVGVLLHTSLKRKATALPRIRCQFVEEEEDEYTGYCREDEDIGCKYIYIYTYIYIYIYIYMAAAFEPKWLQTKWLQMLQMIRRQTKWLQLNRRQNATNAYTTLYIAQCIITCPGSRGFGVFALRFFALISITTWILGFGRDISVAMFCRVSFRGGVSILRAHRHGGQGRRFVVLTPDARLGPAEACSRVWHQAVRSAHKCASQGRQYL